MMTTDALHKELIYDGGGGVIMISFQSASLKCHWSTQRAC